jgi:predicted oxidoreductase
MKTYNVPHTDLAVSRIAYGCAMLGGNWDKEAVSAEAIAKAVRVINTAYDNGITFFDHADVYGFGKSETAFGEVLKQSPGLRDKIVIQSKCGQRLPSEWRPGNPIRLDLSRGHIVNSAEGSLRRLRTDHLDILLLHLPDALMEPEEVAKAFDELHRSGKVRYFGVSNHTAAQIELLKKYIRQPLVINQIRLGLAHSYPIADGIEFTLEVAKGSLEMHGAYWGVAGTGTLDYCRLHEIQIQAWSPLRSTVLNSSGDATPELQRAAQLLADLARKTNTTPSAIALAWLLRHPAGIVPIIGSTSPEHVIENCAADRLTLSREEWYTLFASAAEISFL